MKNLKTISILLLFSLAAILSGCGGGGGGDSSPSTTQAAATSNTPGNPSDSGGGSSGGSGNGGGSSGGGSGGNSGGGSSSATGSLAISLPNNFPYNEAKNITVTLAVSPTPQGALGFSNLTLHTNPSSVASLLTISPSSSCTSISANSTTNSCSFTVTNNNLSAASALDHSSYYVTATFNGQTVTSNTATPSTSSPPAGTYWSININNLSNSNKYLFMMGKVPTDGGPFGVVTFDDNNYGTLHTYDSNVNYGSERDSIILVPGMNTIHIPYGTSSGRAYISQNRLQGIVLHTDGGIVLPDPGNPNDPSYQIVYDNFEFTYATSNDGNGYAVVNQTAVDYLSIPLCLTWPGRTPAQAGFCTPQTRDALLNPVVTAFQNIDNALGGTQWQSLILRNGSTILRIMNPASGAALLTSPPPGSNIQSFANYLNPYITALANYYSAPNSLKVVSPDGTQVLTGQIIPGSPPTYVFTNSGNGGSGSMSITSSSLLTGASPNGANLGTVIAYQMVSSAFMAGQLPPTAPIPAQGITQAYLVSHPETFYHVNTIPGISYASTGQYSVFSSVLNTIESAGIYTYAYDDTLEKSSTMLEASTPNFVPSGQLTITIRY